MSDIVSRPLPASIIRVDWTLYALSVSIRFLQGFGFSLVMAASLSQGRSPDVLATDSFSAVALALASFFIGAAAGVAVDRLLDSRCGIRTATCFSVISLAAGFGVLLWNSGPEFSVVAAVIIGLGFGTNFSTVSELARLSTSNVVRWKAMRCWSTAFAVGISVSMLIAGLNFSLAIYVGLLVGLVSLVCVGVVAIPARSELACAPSQLTAEAGAVPCESHVHEEGHDVHSAEDSSCESDSGESGCCGGAKPVTPTSFRHGVLLNVSGWLALIYCLWPWMESGSAAVEGGALVALSIGIAAGYFLMITVAPNAGYSVGLLPFLLLGFVFSIVPVVAGVDSLLLSVCLFVTGIASGATLCATNAVVGEHFRDSATDLVRSRIFCVSFCTTTVVILAIECLQIAFSVGGSLKLLPACVFVACVLLIRAIPNPILSNLGSNELSERDDEELDDVMAAING